MTSEPKFHLLQIVYLEHEETRLYAEVIQIVESRPICWVRPLGLVIGSEASFPTTEPFSPLFYDLRQAPDLLWAIASFQPALDTDILPLLSHLRVSDTQSEPLQVGQHQLNRFIWQVWQTMPESTVKTF